MHDKYRRAYVDESFRIATMMHPQLMYLFAVPIKSEGSDNCRGFTVCCRTQQSAAVYEMETDASQHKANIL